MIYPVAGFMAISFATFIVEEGMSSVFGGGLSLEHMAAKLPVNIVLGHVLETTYLNFVFRPWFYQILTSRRPRPQVCEMRA